MSWEGYFFKQSASHTIKHTGCSHHYEGDPEEETMLGMCHTGETYSSIQANREDDQYYKQLNQ